jgi:prophage antirepressor-like protein
MYIITHTRVEKFKMDILKSFFLNETEHNINILWENDKPLFRANEIGKILDIKNIRSSIEDFDNDEKVVRQI